MVSKITAFIAFTFLLNTAQAANFCVGGSSLSHYGFEYYYIGYCSWTTTPIVKSTKAFFNILSEEKKAEVKVAVDQKLSQVGVLEIVNLNGAAVYSDRPLAEGQSLCLKYSGSVACTPNSTLMANILVKEPLDVTLTKNGYSKVSQIERNIPGLSANQSRVEVYVK